MSSVHRRPTLLLIALLALAGACSPPGSGPDGGRTLDPDGGATLPMLTIGTGADRFIGLSDGDTVDIVRGPQGGHHIWGALRVRAPLDPRQIAIVYRVLADGSRQELSSTGYRLDLLANGAEHEWFGLLGLIPNPSVVSGKAVYLRLEVSDARGQRAEDERRVTTRGP